MRSDRKLLSILSATTIAVSFAHSARAEEIIIGAATAQTGAIAPYDQPSLAGLKYAIDQINANGGLGKKAKVTLLTKDTRSEAATTVTATQELIDEGAKILVAPCDVDTGIAAGQIAQAAGIPAISTCASTPSLTSSVGDMMFLAAIPADNLQAAALATFARKQGYKNAFVVKSPDNSYSLKLPEYFAQSFGGLGGKLVGDALYQAGQPDFSAIVAKIKAAEPKPDVIMTSAYEPDFPVFIKAVRGAGIETPVLGSDGLVSPTITGLGHVVDGVVYSCAAFASPGSALEAFNKKFTQDTGIAIDTTNYATGYDLGMLLDAAAAAAPTLDPKAIRDALANLSNFKGVSGTITYAGTNRTPLRDVSLVKIQDGKLELVEAVTPDPKSVPQP